MLVGGQTKETQPWRQLAACNCFTLAGMASPGPHNLFVGEMTGAQEPPSRHLPGSRLVRRGGVTWQQDTGGNWIRRLEAAAARSEATLRGSEGRPGTSLRGTNPGKVFRNQQQLHRELLFTHRKGLSLRSKPELLQVLEHRNRRQEGTESGSEQSPLEQEFLRWQQKREQHHQQEGTGDAVGKQPEFIRIRENLRRTQRTRDPPPQHADPSSISNPFPRSHLTNRHLSRVPTSQSPGAPEAEAPMLSGSPEATSLSSGISQSPLANT